MIRIKSESTKYFSIDEIFYAKIYQPLKKGSESIGLHNVFDTRQDIFGVQDYGNIEIEGTVYSNQADSIAAILAVTFNLGVAGGDGTTGEGISITDVENYVDSLNLPNAYAPEDAEKNVQADMSQEDEAAADFVKNKTSLVRRNIIVSKQSETLVNQDYYRLVLANGGGSYEFETFIGQLSVDGTAYFLYDNTTTFQNYNSHSEINRGEVIVMKKINSKAFDVETIAKEIYERVFLLTGDLMQHYSTWGYDEATRELKIPDDGTFDLDRLGSFVFYSRIGTGGASSNSPLKVLAGSIEGLTFTKLGGYVERVIADDNSVTSSKFLLNGGIEITGDYSWVYDVDGEEFGLYSALTNDVENDLLFDKKIVTDGLGNYGYVPDVSEVWSDWIALSHDDVNVAATSTRFQYRTKGDLVHLELVSANLAAVGFFGTLPFGLVNSFYCNGIDTSPVEAVPVAINGAGKMYAYAQNLRNLTVFFYRD